MKQKKVLRGGGIEAGRLVKEERRWGKKKKENMDKQDGASGMDGEVDE